MAVLILVPAKYHPVDLFWVVDLENIQACCVILAVHMQIKLLASHNLDNTVVLVQPQDVTGVQSRLSYIGDF